MFQLWEFDNKRIGVTQEPLYRQCLRVFSTLSWSSVSYLLRVVHLYLLAGRTDWRGLRTTRYLPQLNVQVLLFHKRVKRAYLLCTCRQDTVEGQDDDLTPVNNLGGDGSLYSGSSTLPLVGDSITGVPGGDDYPPSPTHKPHKPNGTLNSGE